MWLVPSPAFVPHRWLRGPHGQTIAGAYLWRRRAYRAKQRGTIRHLVSLVDGDQVVLHDDRPADENVRRTVLLLHGLAGCHGSGYMIRVASKLCGAGYRVFRLDLRGCGAGTRLARASLHAGRIDDIAVAARFVSQLCPGLPLSLVGFSFGASMVLKLLGDEGASPDNIDSAIAVAPPLDLHACSQNLNRGSNRIYDRSFVRTLRRDVAERRRHVPDFQHRPWSRPPATLYEFDEMFTAPLGGFRDVADYYRCCSSLPDLPQIRVQTHILFSQDDPLVPVDVFRQADFSSSTRVYATEAGGHLGFLSDVDRVSPDADWHWMDWRIVDWIRRFDDPIAALPISLDRVPASPS